uniref:Uncharacterized protein n=1 Tax=Spironucleus salmonicida TaxID=348837 RepID=V6M4T6_9EUKA|eukprot:EST48369.1 Hypothetical protein SS50377_11468 [Spironucleus salmonicida]
MFRCIKLGVHWDGKLQLPVCIGPNRTPCCSGHDAAYTPGVARPRQAAFAGNGDLSTRLFGQIFVISICTKRNNNFLQIRGQPDIQDSTFFGSEHLQCAVISFTLIVTAVPRWFCNYPILYSILTSLRSQNEAVLCQLGQQRC